MANSVTVTNDTIEGVDSVVYADVTFSSTYATGGETIAPATLGLSRIKAATLDITAASTVVDQGFYLASTGKFVFRDATGAQVANGASLTGVTGTIRVVGA